MSSVHETLDERLITFLEKQSIFFVATAPTSPDGHINLSPKGLDGTFRVLDERTVAYLDLTGSGVETIAHLRENERIVLMFCAFSGPPNIVRIHGRGEVLLPDHPEFAALREGFSFRCGDPASDARSIIRIHATRISDSCGYGVPRFALRGERKNLTAWITKKGPEGLREYQAKRNRASIDGLPGLSGDDDDPVA